MMLDDGTSDPSARVSRAIACRRKFVPADGSARPL